MGEVKFDNIFTINFKWQVIIGGQKNNFSSGSNQ